MVTSKTSMNSNKEKKDREKEISNEHIQQIKIKKQKELFFHM